MRTPNGRGILIAATLTVALLAAGAALAGRTTLESMGVCQPESDESAVGWDTTPAPGNWGNAAGLGIGFAVVWENDAADKPENGREATCTIPGTNGWVPKQIKLHYLEGLANDDFCVYILNNEDYYIEVGCFDEESGYEHWQYATFDLPKFTVAPGQDVTVKIRATGNSWSGFNTFGQLAVDYIDVLGSPGRGPGNR